MLFSIFGTLWARVPTMSPNNVGSPNSDNKKIHKNPNNGPPVRTHIHTHTHTHTLFLYSPGGVQDDSQQLFSSLIDCFCCQIINQLCFPRMWIQFNSTDFKTLKNQRQQIRPCRVFFLWSWETSATNVSIILNVLYWQRNDKGASSFRKA